MCVGLKQGRPQPPVRSINSINKISSQGQQEVQFGIKFTVSVLFADDGFMLASMSNDLQCVRGWFSARCEVTRLKTAPPSLQQNFFLFLLETSGLPSWWRDLALS